MWIYDQDKWPNFSWEDKSITSKLALARNKQGILMGKMQMVGFELKDEATLKTITKDVVHSSAIEGELLNSEEVRSSVATRLGIEIAGMKPVGRQVDGIVEMMLDATQNYATPLTAERLFGWHAALFPTGYSGMHKITVANWRQPSIGKMQVISGPFGKEKVHFVAPDANRLASEMKTFLKWFNGDVDCDPLLHAAIAHLWFITIHPFEDGNGRIARAIADMALARADNSAARFYSMSSQIEKDRKDYYIQLEKQQRGSLDISDWLCWFLDCFESAIDNAEITLSFIFKKFKIWEAIHKNGGANQRQQKVLNRMLEENFEGFLNTSKYAKLTKCSTDTALRDIKDLQNKGTLLINDGGGRSTSYRLVDI